jgi:hypothetical protein
MERKMRRSLVIGVRPANRKRPFNREIGVIAAIGTLIPAVTININAERSIIDRLVTPTPST